MADETTDVAVIKEVIVYARFMGNKRKIKITFLSIVEVNDGRAITIMDVLRKLCSDNARAQVSCNGALVASEPMDNC